METEIESFGLNNLFVEDLDEEYEDMERMQSPPDLAKRRSTIDDAALKAPSTPVQQFRRPKPSVGDIFPSASDSNDARRLRRLHTVGLR